MLFVKVPENWMLKYLNAQVMADSARAFFAKGSRRIVSKLVTRRASTGIPPAMLTAVPRKWLRLVNFSDSIKDYEERR
jgi:hypothetical protein